MRRLLVATAVVSVALAGAAAAAPPELPKVPQDCHEWNDLLGIDNVRSCDDPPAGLS